MRQIKLQAWNADDSGDVYEIELLRPLSWLKQTGAKVGKQINLEIAEIGLQGKAEVLAIGACPRIKTGGGRVTLMTVTHFSSQIMELRFAGLQKALEPTVSHPFYSEDRNAWITAGELHIGEQIRTSNGSARLIESKWQPHTQRVYNLEVEADHSYYVSQLELLTHNAGCGKVFKVAAHAKQPVPRPSGLQSHHIIQDKVAGAANITGYSRNAAPTILLPRGTHAAVTSSQATRNATRAASGQGRFSNSIRNEFHNASRDLRQAGVPDAARKKAITQAYKHFDNLGALN